MLKLQKYDRVECSKKPFPHSGSALRHSHPVDSTYKLQQLRNEKEMVRVTQEDGSIKTVIRQSDKAVMAKRGYILKNTIGSGHYSKVKIADDVFGFTKRVAVKIINLDTAPRDFRQKFLPREMEVWQRLKHPNIVHMLTCFRELNKVFMVLEYVEEGDMLAYIKYNGRQPENIAKKWSFQLLDAVNYLHRQNIAHRDLKLENILLDCNKNVKLCDFGFSKGNCISEMSKTYCGSKAYAAPEILRGNPYDPKKSDVWSIGVVIYVFLHGVMPFDDQLSHREILSIQRDKRYDWPKNKDHSKHAKNLIDKMLTYDPVSRITVNQAMFHDWLQSCRINCPCIISALTELATDLKDGFLSPK